MKRFHFILLVWLVFSATALADGDKRLVILHTNDTHSTILPVSPFVEDTMKADRGGLLSLRGSARATLNSYSSTAAISVRGRRSSPSSTARSRLA